MSVPSVPPIPSPPAPVRMPSGVTVQWSYCVQYQRDMGLAPMSPAGGVGAPMELVRVRSPACIKNLFWAAQGFSRDSLPLPSEAPSNDNEKLIGSSVTAAFPGVAPDGNAFWTAIGCYVYALQLPPTANDYLNIGAGPFAPPGVAALSPAAFFAQYPGPYAPPSAFNLPSINY